MIHRSNVGLDLVLQYRWQRTSPHLCLKFSLIGAPRPAGNMALVRKLEDSQGYSLLTDGRSLTQGSPEPSRSGGSRGSGPRGRHSFIMSQALALLQPHVRSQWDCSGSPVKHSQNLPVIGSCNCGREGTEALCSTPSCNQIFPGDGTSLVSPDPRDLRGTQVTK